MKPESEMKTPKEVRMYNAKKQKERYWRLRSEILHTRAIKQKIKKAGGEIPVLTPKEKQRRRQYYQDNKVKILAYKKSIYKKQYKDRTISLPVGLQETNVLSEEKMRTCLGYCDGKEFLSSGRYNRICPECSNKIPHMYKGNKINIEITTV